MRFAFCARGTNCSLAACIVGAAQAAQPRTPARGARGWTLIELVVAMTVLGIVAAAIVPSYIGPPQQARDTLAKDTADKLAGNMAYAYVVNGRYPSRTSACWATIMNDLNTAGVAQLPLSPPAVFVLDAQDASGCGLLVYTNNGTGAFEVQFKATGGTGQAFCRDPNGLAAIAWQATDGPWTGCL